MNYKEEYDRLIKYYQDNPISKNDCYCESHHITPASCGGSNDKENLVNLPADIHYKVHCYLPFIYLEQGKMDEYRKMIFAWTRLLNSPNKRKILYNIDENAMEYKKLKEHACQISRQLLKDHFGSNHPAFGTQWYKDPNDRTKSIKIKKGDKIPEGWVRGRWIFYNNEIRKQNISKFYKEHKVCQITNGIINTKKLIDDPMPEGFWIGVTCSENRKQQRSKSLKAYHKTKRLKILPLINEQYEFYKTHTWDEFVKKYNYKLTRRQFTCLAGRYLKLYKNELQYLEENHQSIE